MSQEPATPNSYAALSLDQVIGLFLAQLYGWLIRCHESGAQFAPADMAQNVTKADALVHAFIRSRAAAQLQAAGYLDAARAMRTPTSMRASPLDMPQLANTPTYIDPVTPEDLLVRLEGIIAQFERADAIGGVLARIIFYTLALFSPEVREVSVYAEDMSRQPVRTLRLGAGSLRLTVLGRGPPGSTIMIPTGQVLRTRPPPLYKGRKGCRPILPTATVQLSPLKRGRWRRSRRRGIRNQFRVLSTSNAQARMLRPRT